MLSMVESASYLGAQIMLDIKVVRPFGLLLSVMLSGCGLAVPEYDLLSTDQPAKPGGPSPQGEFESDTVAHIRCEIGNALKNILDAPDLGRRVQWLRNWGVTATVKLTVDELSTLTPGASITTPFPTGVTRFASGNVTTPQSFALGLGLSGSAHSTRLETITFAYSNNYLIKEAEIDERTYNSANPCDGIRDGLVVEGDLKIAEFLYDKATIAAQGEATNGDPSKSPFSTLSNDLTFLTSFGGSVDPTWHLIRVTANSSPTLFSATRTNTNELILTFGPINKKATTSPTEVVLSDITIMVHNAALIGSATGSANQSQIH
jgi:hypothetical protein